MRILALGMIFQLIIQLSNAQQHPADTVRILKLKDSEFILDYKPNNTSKRFKEFVLIDIKGNVRKLSILGHLPRVEENQIVIPLSLFINPFSQKFYLPNFPSTRGSIDTTQFYNKCDLGKIVGSLNQVGELIFRFELNDDNVLINVDHEKVRKAYNRLTPEGNYVQWDCKDWEKAYYLFHEIAWLTLLYQTFTRKEYERLEKLLVPCLGAEYGEGFLADRELIRFLNIP